MRTVRWGVIGAGAAMLIASGLSAPAQAAYTVTLAEQGTSVVATGNGTIDTAGLGFVGGSFKVAGIEPAIGLIFTGPATSQLAYQYLDSSVTGPRGFGSGSLDIGANSGSGDIVGIFDSGLSLFVPAGYVSRSPLSDSATWDNASFSSLGVTPGTYVWTWGSGANADSFTLNAGVAAVPAPSIGRGLPVLLAVGGILLGAKLLERSKKHRLQFG